MAFTFHGIGSHFYGKRDFRSDGSYVTTEWVVIFYVPVVPVRSLRVRYLGVPARPFLSSFFCPGNDYALVEARSLHRKQVMFTYAFLVVVLVWFYAWNLLTIKFDPRDTFGNGAGAFVIFLGAFVPAVIPWLLRRSARRRFRT